jgi:hypothetical protein
MGVVGARLSELGIVLPAIAPASGNYIPYRLVGSLLFVSGQIPRIDGVEHYDQPEGRARREAGDLRTVGLGQVDDDPLHQPPGRAPEGPIIVDGTELTNDLKKIDEIRRDVGMVFQHFNLFPHLTILEN